MSVRCTLFITAGLALTSCGGVGDKPSSSDDVGFLESDATGTTVISSVPIGGDSLLDGLPDEFSAEAECTLSVEEWVNSGEFVLRADRLVVGERRMVEQDAFTGTASIRRTITLENPRVVSADPASAAASTAAAIVQLTEIEASQLADGSFQGFGRDLSELAAMSDVYVSGYASLDGEPLLGVVAGDIDGVTRTASACSALVGARVDSEAPSLGFADGVDLLIGWAAVRGTPEADRFVRVTAPASDDDEVAQAEDAWRDAPSDFRSLNPVDVPSDVRERIDVRVAYVDVTFEGREVIKIRTESGVSSAIASPAMGSVIPLFFVVGTDTTIEVILGAADSAEGRVLASIPVAEVKQAAGLSIVGSETDLVVDVLSEVDVARLMNVDVDTLERIQVEYLTVE